MLFIRFDTWDLNIFSTTFVVIGDLEDRTLGQNKLAFACDVLTILLHTIELDLILAAITNFAQKEESLEKNALKICVRLKDCLDAREHLQDQGGISTSDLDARDTTGSSQDQPPTHPPHHSMVSIR